MHQCFWDIHLWNFRRCQNTEAVTAIFLFKCSDWSNLRRVVVKPDPPGYTVTPHWTVCDSQNAQSYIYIFKNNNYIGVHKTQKHCVWWFWNLTKNCSKAPFFIVDSQTYGSPERREREKISVEAFCESDLKLFSLLCLWHKNMFAGIISLNSFEFLKSFFHLLKKKKKKSSVKKVVWQFFW